MAARVLTTLLLAGALLSVGVVAHTDPFSAVQTARRGADDAMEHGRPVAAPATAGNTDAKALFEAKCSICHALSRPLGERKDVAGWTKTVTRMQKVNGCPITDQEAKAIIDYLVSVRGPAGK